MPNFVQIDGLSVMMDGKMHGRSRERGMETWCRTLLKDMSLDFLAFSSRCKDKFGVILLTFPRTRTSKYHV